MNATSNDASRNSTSTQSTSESTAAITGRLVSLRFLFPAPSSCPPVYPLIYHSISEEIPDASRPLITRLYQLWLVLLATLLLNMLACIFVLAAGASDGGKDLGGSIGCASLFPSDHSLIRPKLPVRNRSPLFFVMVQVSPSPLTICPSSYTAQTDLQWLHEGAHFPSPSDTPSRTSSPGTSFILLSVIFSSFPPPRVSPLARLVLLLWWFSPPFQCLYVSPFPTLPSPLLLSPLNPQDYRYP